jgi:flagellar export protein FliJ
MKSFRFPLQRVLDWRGIQLRTEEEKLAGLQQKLASLIHREKALTAAQLRSESAVLASPIIEGSDLRALAGFRVRIKSERAALQASRTQCQAQIAEQRERLLKARKDCRVLEQLKEKRHKAWSYLGEREIEETAAESYISNWLRSNAER